MVEIRLLDEKWMEQIINDLLNAEEFMTEIEEDVCREDGYQEENIRISTIERMAAGTPTEKLLFEYKDAIESKSGYTYNAAYLNGIKKGFQLAMFMKQE